MSLPRTTSGKVRRNLTARLFAGNELTIVARWQKRESTLPGAFRSSDRSDSSVVSRSVENLADQIERRILEWLRVRVGVSPDQLDRNRPFAEHGVDSMAAVELSCELENWLGVKLSPMTAWQYPTPAAISRHLAMEAGCGGSSAEQAEPVDAEQDEGFAQLLEGIENLSESEASELLSENPPQTDHSNP